MSILDNIYKSSSNVAESLDTTAETLQMMSKADAKEYSEDRKFRKYEKERDKKDRQDRTKIVSGVNQRLDNAVSDAKGRQEQGGQGIGLAAAGLAAIIAANVKKYVQKNPVPTGSNDEEPSPTSTDTNNQTEDVEVQGFQSGGFAGKVPNIGQPSTGDHYYTSVQPGSYILNRNAVSAMGFQSGGSVPVALEQGEIALPPGSFDRGLMDFMNYSAFPRFQQGGQVGEADQTGAESQPLQDTDAPVPQVDLDNIKPGGKIDFIGDGSGFTGEFTIYDGAGKKIAKYGAASGNASTRESSQDARATQSGKNLPLPDGDYPLMGLVQHPGQYVGDWSDYVNSEGGHIGGRGEILVHPDLGLDGTAGCVGVQLGGARGTESEKKFLDIYKAAQPKRIKVDLDAQGVGKEGTFGDKEDGTGSPGTPSNTGSEPAEKVDPLAGAGAFAGALKSLFGELDSALGLGEFGMSSMGILFGNPFGDYTGEGDSPITGDDSTGDSPTVENTSSSAGATSISDPNAKALLNAIARAEGTTGSYGTMFGVNNVNKDLAAGKLTVREAYNLGMKNPGSGATGRYQFMPATMTDLVNNYKVWKWDDKLTPALQDKGALTLAEKKRGVNLTDGLSMKEIQALSWEWASIKGNNYTYNGKSQGYVDQSSFMKWYTKAGGKPQKKQAGGSVMPTNRGVDKLQAMIKEEVENFFEQSNLSTQAEAMMGEPTVVFAGGGGEEGGGSVSMSRSASNLPAYDIQPRDNCPLSMYYMYNPSFNPMALGVQ